MSALANGQLLTWIRITIPWSGRPLVEAHAPEDIIAPGGLVTWLLGDLTQVATLVPGRFGTFAGAWRGQAVAGRGGWSKQASAKGYRSPIGVLNTEVILDAAREAGELPPVVQVPHVIGQFYVRRGDQALSQVFRQISPISDWWIDELGIAQVGVRPPVPTIAPFEMIERDPDRGRVIISTETPSAFKPGVTFIDPLEGPVTVNGVVWTYDATQLRGEVWTA